VKLIKITENDAGQRLDRFLMKAFPRLTNGVIRRCLREKRLRLNGIHAKDAGIMLSAGDVLNLYINDELLQGEHRDFSPAIALPKPIVAYEDEHILIADKPPGLPVHPGNDNEADTLIMRIKAYLIGKTPESQKSLTFEPALCHRLDTNTCGLIIAAKTASALRIMTEKIRERQVQKLYLCLVKGIFEQKSGTLTAYLQKLPNENRVIIAHTKTPDNLTIKTAYRVLEEIGKNSLLEVDLLTGRTHQIRAHMAHIGHPILGDGKYGDYRDFHRDKRYPFQALCAHRLTFNWTTDAGALNYLNGKTVTSAEPWFLRESTENIENIKK
jgi:23S rRNA pseudouridine955/2504/2580 synthase